MAQWPVEGVQLITSYPDDAIRAQATDSFSAIIALTHDPRIDDMGLMEALTTDAYFIGAMGSTKTSENRKGPPQRTGYLGRFDRALACTGWPTHW